MPWLASALGKTSRALKQRGVRPKNLPRRDAAVAKEVKEIGRACGSSIEDSFVRGLRLWSQTISLRYRGGI